MQSKMSHLLLFILFICCCLSCLFVVVYLVYLLLFILFICCCLSCLFVVVYLVYLLLFILFICCCLSCLFVVVFLFIAEIKVPEVRHFIFKNFRLNQYTMPLYGPPYVDEKERERYPWFI